VKILAAFFSNDKLSFLTFHHLVVAFATELPIFIIFHAFSYSIWQNNFHIVQIE